MMKELGYGKGYQYAHDLPDQIARMDCLPDALRGRSYYRPKNVGVEGKIAERLKRWKALRQPPPS
jgi:putative ATPase